VVRRGLTRRGLTRFEVLRGGLVGLEEATA